MDHSFRDGNSKDLPLIMVAEGNADEMGLISDVLGERDYRILGYSDCDRAYDLLRREIPVLAIIDVGLCGNKGIDLIRKIRSEGKLLSLPVIAIVAGELEKDLAGGGADVFLVRPFDADSLKKTVASLLKEE